MIRILVIDDDDRLRRAWERFIGSQSDMEHAGSLESADDLEAAMESLKPDIVLVDLTMPGVNPLEAVRDASARHEAARFVIYSGYSDEQSMQAAFDAGAWGFVDKLTAPAETLAILRRIAGGEVVFPPNFAQHS